MRKFFKTLFFTAFWMVVLAGGVFLYARYIEPKGIKTEQIVISNDKITESFTVAIFSDVHIDEENDTKLLEKAAAEIKKHSPDFVFFLGDLYDNYGEYSSSPDRVTEILKGIDGKYKLAVYGNHDYGGSAKKAYGKIMEQSGFTILKNENLAIESLNLNIIGLDDYIFGTREKKWETIENMANIALAHGPDSLDLLDNIDFFTGGHSHGGQVRLPFIKPFVLPKGAEKYYSGSYDLDGGGVAYINRGIGTSILPLRFFSPPEITICKFLKKTQ